MQQEQPQLTPDSGINCVGGVMIQSTSGGDWDRPYAGTRTTLLYYNKISKVRHLFNFDIFLNYTFKIGTNISN